MDDQSDFKVTGLQQMYVDECTIHFWWVRLPAMAQLGCVKAMGVQDVRVQMV